MELQYTEEGGSGDPQVGSEGGRRCPSEEHQEGPAPFGIHCVVVLAEQGRPAALDEILSVRRRVSEGAWSLGMGLRSLYWDFGAPDFFSCTVSQSKASLGMGTASLLRRVGLCNALLSLSFHSFGSWANRARPWGRSVSRCCSEVMLGAQLMRICHSQLLSPRRIIDLLAPVKLLQHPHHDSPPTPSAPPLCAAFCSRSPRAPHRHGMANSLRPADLMAREHTPSP